MKNSCGVILTSGEHQNHAVGRLVVEGVDCICHDWASCSAGAPEDKDATYDVGIVLQAAWQLQI